MRIVFMGTPDFAVPSLKKLVTSSHQVAGVVTQPDRPKGRGLKMMPPPVKSCAQKYNLEILQPQSLDDLSFHQKLHSIDADCHVVVAFRILPPEVYQIPHWGAINLHASLLPQYRGAAPIQWAIINGEEKTGLTTFQIKQKVDTGDILLQKDVAIQSDETAGQLHDRMSRLGADLVLQTLDGLEMGTIDPYPQSGEVSLAPKINKSHCEIDWKNSAERIRNQIRGLTPVPGAFSFLGSKQLKIYQSSAVAMDETKFKDKNIKPGSILDIGSDNIRVMTGSGFLEIQEVQLEGKKRMPMADFLRGYPLKSNTILGRV